jgi:hypothetical protein
MTNIHRRHLFVEILNCTNNFAFISTDLNAWEPNSHSPSQEIPCLSQVFTAALKQIIPLRILTHYFSEIDYEIIIWLMPADQLTNYQTNPTEQYPSWEQTDAKLAKKYSALHAITSKVHYRIHNSP